MSTITDKCPHASTKAPYHRIPNAEPRNSIPAMWHATAVSLGTPHRSTGLPPSGALAFQEGKD